MEEQSSIQRRRRYSKNKLIKILDEEEGEEENEDNGHDDGQIDEEDSEGDEDFEALGDEEEDTSYQLEADFDEGSRPDFFGLNLR